MSIVQRRRFERTQSLSPANKVMSHRATVSKSRTILSDPSRRKVAAQYIAEAMGSGSCWTPLAVAKRAAEWPTVRNFEPESPLIIEMLEIARAMFDNRLAGMQEMLRQLREEQQTQPLRGSDDDGV